MHVVRPSYHELDKKIKGARAALMRSSGLFANINKAVGELYALNIESPKEIWLLILELLEEITPEDYAGTKPPQKSYEAKIRDEELFAFCWYSKILEKRMYIKFALIESNFYYVSLHASKETL